MARLPVPGLDENTWGDILNDYLSQAHQSDGTLKDDSVGSAQLASNAVNASAVADGALPQSKVQNLVSDLAAKATAAQITSAVNDHADASDPHAAASYAIMVGGGRRVYVQDTQPTDMQEGDIWIDTSGI